jgi:hypothetical protein
MSPINQCSMFVNRCLTFITVSMAVRGEKLDGGPADRSTGVLRIVPGAIFLGSSRVCPTLLGQRERLSRTACQECVRIVCIRFSLQGVY